MSLKGSSGSENKPPREEPPIVKAIGMADTAKGTVLFLLKIKNDEVIDKEVLSGPQPRAHALESAKVWFVKTFMGSGGARA